MGNSLRRHFFGSKSRFLRKKKNLEMKLIAFLYIFQFCTGKEVDPGELCLIQTTKIAAKKCAKYCKWNILGFRSDCENSSIDWTTDFNIFQKNQELKQIPYCWEQYQTKFNE